jgi:hypothetical protein
MCHDRKATPQTAPAPAVKLAPRRVRRALDAHLGSRQVSRVIYGTTIGLALVVALQDHSPSPGVVAGTLLATAVAIALAELYSEIVGTEARTRRLGIGRREIRRLRRDVAATAFGIAFPAVIFAVAAVGLFELQTAFAIAKWSGLGLLAFYGFCAARMAGARITTAFLYAGAVALIGAILIAVKSLLH